MPITKEDHLSLLKERPELNNRLKTLKVGIIGAPNAGKSLLTNQLVAWKFSSVSSKVHTTRAKMVGVCTEGENQLIFMDTPGVIEPASLKKHNLERTLLIDPHVALFESDIIVFVIDISTIWGRMRIEQNLLQILEYHKNKPSVLVLNKVDLLKRKYELLEVTRRLTNGKINGVPFMSTESKVLNADNIILKFKESNSNKELSNRTSLNNKYEYRDKSNFPNDETITNENLQDCSEATDDKIEKLGFLEKDNCVDGVSNKSLNSLDLSGIKEVEMLKSPNKVTKSSDLYNPIMWNDYYSTLKKMGKDYSNGWPYFQEVFMLSSLSGDGIFELKNYLFSKAKPSSWLYGSSVVTNVEPLELAVMCIREKLLEHVPNEVAYCVEIRKITWEISDDNLLRARFDIICKRKRFASLVMGLNGATIQKVSREAKQSLMNAFRREMTLQLVVKSFDN